MAPRSGKVMKRIGVTLVAASFIAPLALQFLFDQLGEVREPPLGLTPLLLIPGALLYYRGRQYAARARAESIIAAPTPCVLYLRAFETDRSLVRNLWQFKHWVLLGTEEEHLADALQPVGELMAIGRPRELLPPPGAARIYASPEEWKDVVKHQMQAARLVVIRADASERLFWELTQAIKILDHPQKLLILILNMWSGYESFRSRANLLLPLPLPPSRHLRGWWRRSGFFIFAEDWTPRFVPLGGPQYALKGRFRCALKPVFENFGLAWQAPRVSALRVAAALFVVLMVPLTLFGLWVGPPLNRAVFHDHGAQDAFARAVADGCKSTDTDPTRKARKDRRCECLARQFVKVIDLQEFDAVEKGQFPGSLREKVKGLKC